jgi:hypothetical protein
MICYKCQKDFNGKKEPHIILVVPAGYTDGTTSRTTVCVDCIKDL